MAIAGVQNLRIDPPHRRVIVAAGLGTMFEWYNFFLYGALASIIECCRLAGGLVRLVHEFHIRKPT